MSFAQQLSRFQVLQCAPSNQDHKCPPACLSTLEPNTEHRSEPHGKRNHVALLFLIIDSLPYEAIWREWIKSVEGHVHVFVHAKYPNRVTSNWVRKRVVQSTLEPTWGSVELLKAELLLFDTALRKCPACHFALVSESCVPVISGFDLYLHLGDKSLLDVRTQPENGYSASLQFHPLEKYIVREKVAKASQWCVLTRRDARLAVSVAHRVLPYFNRVKASDEMFFPTTLSLLGVVVESRGVTHTQWVDACDPSPKYLSAAELQVVTNTRSFLFARKLNLGVKVVREVLVKNGVLHV